MPILLLGGVAYFLFASLAMAVFAMLTVQPIAKALAGSERRRPQWLEFLLGELLARAGASGSGGEPEPMRKIDANDLLGARRNPFLGLPQLCGKAYQPMQARFAFAFSSSRKRAKYI